MEFLAVRKIETGYLGRIIHCFCCKRNAATHACKFEMGRVIVEMPLCSECKGMPEAYVIEGVSRPKSEE